MAHENQSAAISNLQRYLRQLAYFDERLGEVPIDGVFDNATEEALRAFQAGEGLPATGRADQITWEALYAAYLLSLEKRAAPARIAHFPRLPENYTIEVGDAQFLVSIIQNALQELGAIYDDLGEVPQNGQYDEATASAVRVFQGKVGLPQTGAVDRRTWNALADAYNRNFDLYFRQ